MYTYAKLSEYLGSKMERPSPESNPLACRIVRLDENRIALRHWQTHTITWYSDGSIVLDSGGWRTTTTKAHINEFLSPIAYVHQAKNIWYLTLHNAQMRFEDGMKLAMLSNGMYFAIMDEPGMSEQEIARLNRRINQYAREFAKFAVGMGHNFRPDGGDCWYCYFCDHTTGLSWGDISKDASHLLAHIEDKYYVPSLLVNAVKETPISEAAKAVLSNNVTFAGWKEVALDHIARSVRIYMKRRLIDGLFDARHPKGGN